LEVVARLPLFSVSLRLVYGLVLLVLLQSTTLLLLVALEAHLVAAALAVFALELVKP
jgi:hypothetical protein